MEDMDAFCFFENFRIAVAPDHARSTGLSAYGRIVAEEDVVLGQDRLRRRVLRLVAA